LTFRLACDPRDEEPPMWPIGFLQNLARYVFESGNAFDDGHWMTANGPIALDTDTAICSMGFAFDPELPAIDTPNGRMSFLQVVGLTDDEERAAKCWRTRALLDVLLPRMPLWITDLRRASLLADAEVRAAVDEGTRRDGSSTDSLFTDVLEIEPRKRPRGAPLLEVTVGARQVQELVELIPARLLFDRPCRLVGRHGELRFERGNANAVTEEEGVFTLHFTGSAVHALAKTLQPRAGEYAVDGFDGVLWRVEKTVIRDNQGHVIQTVG
jgi:hypothetical protein